MAFFSRNVLGGLVNYFRDSPPTPVYDSDRYKPSTQDVLRVKLSLHRISSFPLELIDTIIDLAEYWPHSTTVTAGPTRIPYSGLENRLILRSYPLGFAQSPSLAYEEFEKLHGHGESYTAAQPLPSLDTHSSSQSLTEQTLSELALKFQCRGDHPCRKVVFTIISRDQGWGGSAQDKGTYNGSYTWFDAGLERVSAFHESDPKLDLSPQFRLSYYTFLEKLAGSEALSKGEAAPEPVVCSLRTILPHTITDRTTGEDTVTDQTPCLFKHPLLPSTTALQKNVTSDRTIKEHVVTWSYNDNINKDGPEADGLELQGRGRATGTGGFLRDLRLGDVVTVWAKARFPGWANVIDEVKMDVYWAV